VDRTAFEPVRTAVELIDGFRRQNPSQFAWREPPYEYEHDKEPIDVLWGSPRLRETIESEGDVARFAESWKGDGQGFLEQRGKFLLY
jgi:uncharacterized protein YbbC (DUF1343 family)